MEICILNKIGKFLHSSRKITMNHRFYMKPWEEFLEDWKKITEILNLIEITKKIDLIENMQDYIFKSRKVVRQAHQPNWVVIYILLWYYRRRRLWEKEF